MKFSVLGSGSKGNCTLIESGSTKILIDNGFSGKELVSRLARIGITADSLSALVITHEHIDHIRGVGVLARKLGLPIYANALTYRAAEKGLGQLPVRREFSTGESFIIQDLHIHPFAVSHDTADPVGFVVGDGELCVGYCTDTGKITKLIRHHLQTCQALVLEANHDVEMLRQGPYPLPLKQRVLSSQGHLANIDSLRFAGELAAGRLRHLILAHLSEINNHPDLVRQEAGSLVTEYRELKILLADQSIPGTLTEITP
ncbi:MAG: MBL fold metallo-hydrolase [Desulfobulbus sp.]|nr:MBL fold metallo-hydrolase [Desulfobulbus sp.]